MRLLSFLAALMLPVTALAQDAMTRDDFATGCTPTPPMRSSTYPGPQHITKYNNLVQPEGKSVAAPGQFVYLTGRVLDARCVPLSEARVEIWQAGVSGQYIYPDKGSFQNPYPLFAGTGATVTDGEGRFAFYTLFPGTESSRGAPKIHFHVTHDDTVDLFTTMFFAGDLRNSDDDGFVRLPGDLKPFTVGQVEPFTQSDGSLGLHVHHDITVAGADKFRRF